MNEETDMCQSQGEEEKGTEKFKTQFPISVSAEIKNSDPSFHKVLTYCKMFLPY